LPPELAELTEGLQLESLSARDDLMEDVDENATVLVVDDDVAVSKVRPID
jgi:hypothetical protein